MLRYDVKLSSDNLKKSELVWREKYVSPDLSFVSGVTDTSYHLEKFKALSSSNSINNTDGTLQVEAENVIRQGYVVFNGKKYLTSSGKTVDYSVDESGTTIEYRYIFHNGKYFYWNEDINGYTIDNGLFYDASENSITSVTSVTASSADTAITIDTAYWIENGKVNVDGHEYVYDPYEGDGILKFGYDGDSLEASSVTECTSISYFPYTSTNDYEEVTKFKLTKSDELIKSFTNVSFVNYYYYVEYKNNYCGIRKKVSGDSYSFVCDIPKHVISGTSVLDGLEPIEFNVYFSNDFGDTPDLLYELIDDLGDFLLNSDNYDKHGVEELDELKNTQAFVWLSKEGMVEPSDDFALDEIFLIVRGDVMNSNDGSLIGLYLEDEYLQMNAGETFSFINTSSDGQMLRLDVYSGGTNEDFVFYDGKKYPIIKDLCDKVTINDNEYDIVYDNGKVVGNDCQVVIDGEEVPFKIKSDTELERYGKIVSGGTVVDAIYEIKPYSGVTINGKNYIVNEVEVDNYDGTKSIIKYATTDLVQRLRYVIDEVKGSSMYVCSLDVDRSDFTSDFRRYISSDLSSSLVGNKSSYRLVVKNKIFGDVDITDDLAFRATLNPVSSDDFFNILDDLKIYIDTAYIQLPISFSMNAASNQLQDNIVERDFYEAEKEKAINPIVDMEKDVYLPKYITSDGGQYRGSSTIFKPIYEINLNFHFRTRNLDSWKVNDGYNNVEYAKDNTNESSDNWFITDFYPYRGIKFGDKPDERKNKTVNMGDKTWGEILQETSDLMGLLYFTNDDIFYQKSKVGGSFARLSFYDSTDPQTQSLLATSCVFIDEHKLFKTYIDNSRKNIYDYGKVTEISYKRDESTDFIDPSPTYAGDITHFGGGSTDKDDDTKLVKQIKGGVSCEFIDKKDKQEYSDISKDCVNIGIDESHRISSRLTISNKHVTETSSEGYYLYIFREYAEDLHPKPIYMKVEFNHAGIGKTIPFVIPMHWTKSGTTYYPEKYLRLEESSHLEELKEGMTLGSVYAQTYIPLYAVYDFKNKEYGYVFDERYVKVGKDGVLNLNLFEMKIKDESNEEPTVNTLNSITRHKQDRWVVNVNTKQFDKRFFNYDTK